MPGWESPSAIPSFSWYIHTDTHRSTNRGWWDAEFWLISSSGCSANSSSAGESYHDKRKVMRIVGEENEARVGSVVENVAQGRGENGLNKHILLMKSFQPRVIKAAVSRKAVFAWKWLWNNTTWSLESYHFSRFAQYCFTEIYEANFCVKLLPKVESDRSKHTR